jgi:hypothetical protein
LQDTFIQPSLILPAALNVWLKNNMPTITKLINAAQGIIALAKPSSKGYTVTAKNIQTRTTSSPTVMVTGRDEDRDRIIEMLHDTNEDVNSSSSISKCFSVVGVYGISGSGKTTLAQHVCKYEENKDYFDLVMWVHVSQNYNVGDIFKEMFESASEDKDKACPNYNSLDVLEKELETKLDGKRFLLVLDDIWCTKVVTEQQLPKLLSPLKVGKKGSKILATSRSKDAFSDLGPGLARTVLPIPALDEQVFLELFMYYALDGAMVDGLNGPDQKELRIVGADIAKKLKGSPLAASTVGGQLRKRQNNVNFWKEVRDRDLLNETTGALWWSYHHLDEQIKRCFAYCSIFPSRHRLNRDELVKLWVAEGFIQTNNAEEDVEAVGRDYFHELLATSFVQPGGYYQGNSYYLVHDLMHDLAEHASGSDCFRVENDSRKAVPHDVRHLNVANASMVNEDIFKLKSLRTLIIDYAYEEWQAPVNKDFFEKVFDKLPKLRVLTVKISWIGIMGGGVLRIPETIGHLKHLRYLALVMFERKLIIPTTFTDLYNVQTVKFSNYSVLEVSGDMNMGNLTNLQHIIGEIEMLFPNIGRLTSLQTLESFGVWPEHGYELKQLGALNKLRGSLAILNLHNVKSKNEAQDAKLADKKRLTELRLSWVNYYYTNATPEVEAEVLEGLCPPKDLKILEIWDYHGVTYPSWMMGKQNGGPTYLCKLWLDGCSQLGPAPELFECFIHLRELIISSCNWEHLPDNVKDLMCLKSLMIIRCPYFKLLPELPGSLQEIKVEACGEVFMRSCRQTGDPNWQKLQHVVVKEIDGI